MFVNYIKIVQILLLRETVINMYLPSVISKAIIYVHSIAGEKILEKEIVGRDYTSLKIAGSEIKEGIYIYTLIVDGLKIDSKRMVITP